MERDESFYNRVGYDRITSRQIDELIGLARGICADGTINAAEADFLRAWLAANAAICDQVLIRNLYVRVSEMLSDGEFSNSERNELFETLHSLTGKQFEIGEVMKSANLPFCRPQPTVQFQDRIFAFTGTFRHGQRKACEAEVFARGGSTGGITKKTDYLVVGHYATESWKHSSMGNKIMKACTYRDKGTPISIVSEEHWASFL